MIILRIFKFILIIPYYIFLVIGGFIGSGTNIKDNWDTLYKWAKK